MTEFAYNQVIEYQDRTLDLNFEAARSWAKSHNTTFEENLSARTRVEKEFEDEQGVKHTKSVLMRYFKIGDEPVAYVETEEVKISRQQSQVRQVRDDYIEQCQNRVDRYRNQKDAGLDTTDSEDTFKHLLEYLEFLRNYPQQSNWWESYPSTFDAWEQENHSSQGD